MRPDFLSCLTAYQRAVPFSLARRRQKRHRRAPEATWNKPRGDHRPRHQPQVVDQPRQHRHARQPAGGQVEVTFGQHGAGVVVAPRRIDDGLMDGGPLGLDAHPGWRLGGLPARDRSRGRSGGQSGGQQAEIEARLNAIASPFRTAEATGQDIIDPPQTRALLCDFVDDAQRVIASQRGTPSMPYLP